MCQEDHGQYGSWWPGRVWKLVAGFTSKFGKRARTFMMSVGNSGMTVGSGAPDTQSGQNMPEAKKGLFANERP